MARRRAHTMRRFQADLFYGKAVVEREEEGVKKE
jgi:hypothetical protein